MREGETPGISVVVSTLGMHSSLKRVLDRYETQTSPPGSFEVIVAADAAEPNMTAVEDVIGERPYECRIVRGAVPGLSANRNAGWHAALAPVVMFTDNDTLAEEQLISEHLEWHTAYPQDEIAVLGLVRWADEIEVTPFMRWLDEGIQFDYPNIEGFEAGWGRFYGANVSIKKAFLAQVGDFEEIRLPYGYEDLDFGLRAHRCGMRLLFNRKAVVEHLRPMDLEFWKRRCVRIAQAERQFTAMHPEIEPWFYRMFKHAIDQPKARGRGRHFISYIPKRFPKLGPYLWTSADLYYRQQLAPHFLEAWEAAEREIGSLRPNLAERET